MPPFEYQTGRIVFPTVKSGQHSEGGRFLIAFGDAVMCLLANMITVF